MLFKQEKQQDIQSFNLIYVLGDSKYENQNLRRHFYF